MSTRAHCVLRSLQGSMEPPAAGSLGPRLAGRLTAELILRSPQYMSCVHLYHLDLRGSLLASLCYSYGSSSNLLDWVTLSTWPLPSYTKTRMKCITCPLTPIHERVLAATGCTYPRIRLLGAGNRIAAIENLGATQVRHCPSIGGNMIACLTGECICVAVLTA